MTAPLQITASTEQVNALEPLHQKFGAFGFAVRECDGNDVEDLVRAFEQTPFEPGKPSLIIANTTKGKGVSFMEDTVKWHHRVPVDAEYDAALRELNQLEEAMKVVNGGLR